MKIVIIADGKEQEGSTKEVISHIKRTLRNNDILVKYINEENYLPKIFPIKWKDIFRLFYLRKISNIDLSAYDIVVTCSLTLTVLNIKIILCTSNIIRNSIMIYFGNH